LKILLTIDYFSRWARTYQLCGRIKPDVAMGVGDFYLPQIEKFFADQERSIRKRIEILTRMGVKAKWQKKRDRNG